VGTIASAGGVAVPKRAGAVQRVRWLLTRERACESVEIAAGGRVGIIREACAGFVKKRHSGIAGGFDRVGAGGAALTKERSEAVGGGRWENRS
jgi:hypothetical protein